MRFMNIKRVETLEFTLVPDNFAKYRSRSIVTDVTSVTQLPQT